MNILTSLNPIADAVAPARALTAGRAALLLALGLGLWGCGNDDVAGRQTGATVLAIMKGNGQLLVSQFEDTIKDGDRLIIIGAMKQLAALENTVEGGIG